MLRHRGRGWDCPRVKPDLQAVQPIDGVDNGRVEPRVAVFAGVFPCETLTKSDFVSGHQPGTGFGGRGGQMAGDSVPEYLIRRYGFFAASLTDFSQPRRPSIKAWTVL